MIHLHLVIPQCSSWKTGPALLEVLVHCQPQACITVQALSVPWDDAGIVLLVSSSVLSIPFKLVFNTLQSEVIRLAINRLIASPAEEAGPLSH